MGILKKIGQAAEKAANDVGKAAEKAVHDAGDALEKGAHDAGKLGKEVWTVAADAAKAGGKLFIAPTEAVYKLAIKGESPKAILDDQIEYARNYAKSVAAIGNLETELEGLVVATVDNTLGGKAAEGVAYLLLPKQVMRALPDLLLTDGELEAIIEDPQLGDFVALPLAAAIKHAVRHYEKTAKPVTPKIAQLLQFSGEFSPNHLAGVRYAIHDNDASIADLIIRLQHVMGMAANENYAVTVGNIIVFAKEPVDGVADLYFWAHEVQHTVQYASKGITKFASEYTTNHSHLEQEANDVALRVLERVEAFVGALS